MGEWYAVKSGDNLWSIARKTLGHGDQWPRIWRYNLIPIVSGAPRNAPEGPAQVYHAPGHGTKGPLSKVVKNKS